MYLRIGDAAAPAAPSELLAINAAFLLVLFAIIALMARVAFSNISILNMKGKETDIPSVGKPAMRAENVAVAVGPTMQVSGASRAYQITQSLEASQRREANGNSTDSTAQATNNASDSRYGYNNGYNGNGLGSSYRRTTTRVSRAAAHRDRT